MDYSHTKKLQYIQVINKILIRIVLRWKMVLSFNNIIQLLTQKKEKEKKKNRTVN